ncbi:MAG: hypothetical protein R3F53_16305 [Gammaproteobacteria bacterium]
MTKGAYTSLDELIRLKFRGQGFRFCRASRFTACWQGGMLRVCVDGV